MSFLRDISHPTCPLVAPNHQCLWPPFHSVSFASQADMKGGLVASALVGATSALECTPSAIQSALPSNATVNFAYPVEANGTFNVPKGDTGYPTSPTGLPALCAASVQVQSLGNTTFGFGLFLPSDWNGRFLAVGNGGFAGGINWLDMVRIQVVL